MLKELTIQNLILISSTTIHFDTGLNVLSGETGAGKSAIMKALSLIAGDKADSSLIRHGANKSVIEGLFHIEDRADVIEILEKSGIDHGLDEPLIVRREVSLSGKGKCSINNCTVQLALLRKIGGSLLEMVGQHANQKLLSIDQHRQILDLYGNLAREAAAFADSWIEECGLSQEIEQLMKDELQRARQIDNYTQEIEELHQAALKEGEDEELFAEYTRLANADEILSKINEITNTLNGEKTSVLALLKRHTQLFEQLIRLDPHFDKYAQPHHTALIELEEIAYSLEKYSTSAEYSPERLDTINQRLTLINKFKKKYGDTVEAIRSYQVQAEEKLKKLESADTQIEEGKEKLARLKRLNDELAQNLSTKRKAAAKNLEIELTEQLRVLNMPKARFEIDVAAQRRTSCGDDLVEYFLIPNVGEKRVPIKEHASGGELSRILLALQTLLTEKEAATTLVFDEIDANIGGATAVIIGEKLKEIGKRHQVFCITHFPQVAKQADVHIQIAKKEDAGRTFSQITRLDATGKKHELDRMAGIASR